MPAPSSIRIASILALHVVVAGCTAAHAQAQTAPATQPPPPVATQPPPAVTAPGPGDWASWPRDRKLAYMRTTFMEEIRKVFTGWEPVRFRDMDCRTCHGTGVGDGTFRMPNQDLPVVAPGEAGFKELLTHEPEALEFMQKKVVPEAARLLGLPPFDFKSHRGFSCYHCHVRGQ